MEMDSIQQRIANLSPQKRQILSDRLRQLTKLQNQPISPRDPNVPCLASFSQKRFWFLQQLTPDSSVFNNFRTLKFEQPVNIHALHSSLQTLVNRHEVLRTTFDIQDGELHQIIHRDISIDLPLIDLSDRSEILQDLLKQYIQKPFNLSTDLPLRSFLFLLNSQEYILMLVVHHIASDGWSSRILLDELNQIYHAFLTNQPLSLPNLRIQYADFSAWQQQQSQQQKIQNQLNYWQQKLKDHIPHIDLPNDYPRSAVKTYRGAETSLTLSHTFVEKIKALARKENATLFMVLLAAFKILLSRYSGQNDLIVGSPIAGRNHVEVENIVGPFINLLALRTKLENDSSFLDFLHQVKQTTLAAYEHQDISFEKLLEEINPQRDLSHNPIFQVLFNMLSLPQKRTQHLSELPIQGLLNGEPLAKFDLTVYVRENNQTLTLRWVYNLDLFKPETITTMSKRFQFLLEKLVDNPESTINSISLLSSEELTRLAAAKNLISPQQPNFREFTKTEIEQSIPSRFLKQVENYPQRIAISSKNHQWTYRELHQKASTIAQALSGLIGNNCQRIALLLEHEAPMISAILGTLMSENLYVPLDPNYPQARLEYVIADTQAQVVITDSINWHIAQELSQNLPFTIINIEKLTIHENLVNTSQILPDSLAYILYTSGSTGQPKGVVQNHRNVLHFIRNYTNNLQITIEDRLSLLAPCTTDAAVMDIFGALLNGATLCLYDIKKYGVENLEQWFLLERITIYHSTPTVYRYLIDFLIQTDTFANTFSRKEAIKNQLTTMRLVVLGGEEVVKSDVELYQQYFPENCIFVNGFGPTESTITLQYFIDKNTIDKNTTDLDCLVPLGSPIQDTEIILLNQVGMPTELYGEIAIRSPYLALGYWQSPELTKAVFLTDPQDKAQRVYRTGDLARLRIDGFWEFLGRKDFQVKIRGFRVELGEIESTLIQHPLVKEAVVIVAEEKGREKQLIAYVVPTQAQNPTQFPAVDQLRSFLRQKLPNYMIPNTFIFLEVLPLTSSGKVARKALPPPAQIQHTSNEQFIAPRTPTEQKLAAIWQKILWLEQDISIDDNFFDLGGHSLLAVRLINEIESDFQQKLSLTVLFQLTTIAELAKLLQQQEEIEAPEISTSLEPEIYRQLLIYTAGWKAERISQSSLIFRFNPSGTQHPIFWCTPSFEDIYQIAKHLGEDQPIYGMRSNYSVMQRTEENLHALASHYLQEILSLQGGTPYLIGGFCDGGYLAVEIARQLTKQGKHVALVCTIECLPSQVYAGSVHLIFGRESTFNPYRNFSEPSLGWSKFLTQKPSVDILPGNHLDLHIEPNIQLLVIKIKSAFEKALHVPKSALAENPLLAPLLLASNAYQAKITAPNTLVANAGESVAIAIQVKNDSSVIWQSTAQSGITVGNHWLNEHRKIIQWLDRTVHLPQDLPPAAVIDLSLSVRVPEKAGIYWLELDVVEEGITWFKHKGSSPTFVKVQVQESHFSHKSFSAMADNTTPLHWQANRDLADAQFHKGQLDLAIANYKQAILLNPQQSFAVYFNLSMALVSQRKLPEALSACQTAIQLEPYNAQIYALLGNIQQKQRKLTAAIASYKTAIKLEPQQAQFYQKLGDALRLFGQLKEALATYNQAIDLQPEAPQLYLLRGIVQHRQGKITDAIADYQKTIEFSPERIYDGEYWLTGETPEDTKALTAFYQLHIHSNPHSYRAYICLAQSQFKLGLLDEAISSYQKVIELNHSDAGTYYLLSKILEQQGRIAEAASHLEQAIQIHPSRFGLANIYLRLGDLHLRGKHKDAAIAAYHKASQLQPYNTQVKLMLEKLLSSYLQPIDLKSDEYTIF